MSDIEIPYDNVRFVVAVRGKYITVTILLTEQDDVIYSSSVVRALPITPPDIMDEQALDDLIAEPVEEVGDKLVDDLEVLEGFQVIGVFNGKNIIKARNNTRSGEE